MRSSWGGKAAEERGVRPRITGVWRVGIGSARTSGNLSTSAPDLLEAIAAVNTAETGGENSHEAKERSNLLASQLAQVHEARKLLCNDSQPTELMRDPRRLLDSGYDELTELEKEIGEILQNDEDEEVVEEERHQGTGSCTDDDMDLTSGLITLESFMGNTQREALGDSRGQLLAKVQRTAARDDPAVTPGAPAEGTVAGDAAVALKPRLKEKMTSRITALFRRLIDSEAVLDRKMTMEIVSTAEFIHKVNSDMMKQFASVHNDLARSGPKTFLAMTRWYKLYCMYCDNYERSFSVISHAKKIPAFRSFWKEAHQNPLLNGKQIFSYMSKPLYRVLKYHAMLKEIFGNAPEGYPARADLVEAMKETNTVTAYIMSKKVISSDLQKILSIYYQLSDLHDFDLVSTRRQFIREGMLVKLSPKGKEQERQFFLFDDVLIYARRKRHDKFFVKGVVPMDLVLIREVRVKAGGDHGDKAARSFQLVRLDVKKVHTIRAKNKAEKDEWTKDLQKIVNQYLAKLQEVQKIPQTLDEVVDTAVSFLLWGVLPSAASTAQKSPPMSSNLAFIHQRRPQHLVLPKVLDGDDAMESGKLALNTIYPARDSAGSPYENFVKATSELQRVYLGEMNGAEVITFFLNLYHVILLHAHVEMGAPSAGSPRFSYLETMAYRVGRATLSLFDIEYHVLRARMSKPDIFGVGSRFAKSLKKKSKELEGFALEPNPLLNFAISYLVVGSPEIVVYTPELVAQQLRQATQNRLCRHLVVKHAQGKVYLPNEFEWHAADFLKRAPPSMGEYTHREVQDMLNWCSAYVTGPEGQDFVNLLALHKTKTCLYYYEPNWNFSLPNASSDIAADRPARPTSRVASIPLLPRVGLKVSAPTTSLDDSFNTVFTPKARSTSKDALPPRKRSRTVEAAL
ncbi:PH domain containing protein [Acanthamoeba castellanii str. Neff]|uniref:PH domain containing protein n=1 Tax=Acanthamoeba castellanii (strain ATCC 30010 / Neff) TaxID=1257118 RepID=L8HAW8_ACACF|nr:PH domain containing protein [Acanthamoeba castellanii str. Neff]ELR21546.1 PH domain containing protein [Acanthamoeba castellanii str. Neff]